MTPHLYLDRQSETAWRTYGDAAEMRAVLRNQGWRRYGNRLAPRIRLDVCAQCIPEAAAREPLYEVDR